MAPGWTTEEEHKRMIGYDRWKFTQDHPEIAWKDVDKQMRIRERKEAGGKSKFERALRGVESPQTP